MIKELWKAPLSIWKYFLILTVRFYLNILFFLGSTLDRLFYPSPKRKIESPVFILGHPRSGTTFLHRYLMDSINELDGILLWQLMFPFISLRKIFKPFIKNIDKHLSSQLYNPVIHKTGLLKGETDDIALFFKSFDGLFFWLYFKAFKEYISTSLLKQDLINASKLDKMIEHIDVIYMKSLSLSENKKNRMLSKSFSLILNIDLILKKFPDAKIIILIRDPLETIPSSMSLANSILQKIYNLKTIKKDVLDQYWSNPL